MSLFRKLFGFKSTPPEGDDTPNKSNKYTPEIKLPVDERFMINFKDNGGKFLYCEDLNEVFYAITNILQENNWQESFALALDNNINKQFKTLNFTQDYGSASFFITPCESLIADEGSILFSSHQIAEKKITEFPHTFVVFATTSQIVGSISEGLQRIKSKYIKCLPTNITTLKYFKDVENNNFLNYGSNYKNLYLLLLEDL